MIRTRNAAVTDFCITRRLLQNHQVPHNYYCSALRNTNYSLLQLKRLLSTQTGDNQTQQPSLGRKIQSENATLFQTHPALKRARIKRELKPLLSLAVHQILLQKQNQQQDGSIGSLSYATDYTTVGRHKPDFKASIDLLARWNGYEELKSEHIVVTPNDKGQIPLGRGLVAEANPFANENYYILARRRRNSDHNHPDFLSQDYSWYRALERRINDALDRWEERARDRRQRRRETAKEQLQRSFDAVQAPLADLFVAITTRLDPLVEFFRRAIRWNVTWANKTLESTSASSSQSVSSTSLESESTTSETAGTTTSDNNYENRVEEHPFIPYEGRQRTLVSLDGYSVAGVTPTHSNLRDYWNKTDPEDLIILARDENGGTVVLLLEDIYPQNRLLSLPESTTFAYSTTRKTKLPYRLRLARGGLIITCSLVFLGTIPPAYRSLRFILEYPKTAEIVMITLVGSVAYSLWSWAESSKTEQERRIAAAVNSRLTAKNEAAIAYLTEGAKDNLTHIIMEEYVSRLVAPEGEAASTKDLDPLIREIVLSVGLFQPCSSGEIASSSNAGESEELTAVKWDQARLALVSLLAGHSTDKKQ